MTTEEKSIRTIEFSGKKKDKEGWPEKFLTRGRFKGKYMLFLSIDHQEGDNKVPMKEEYD